jgi:hypothetical protein
LRPTETQETRHESTTDAADGRRSIGAHSGRWLIVYPALTVGISRTAIVGLVVLLAAALGGLVLNLNYHVKHRELPIWLVLVHAAAAVVGFLFLAIAVW